MSTTNEQQTDRAPESVTAFFDGWLAAYPADVWPDAPISDAQAATVLRLMLPRIKADALERLVVPPDTRASEVTEDIAALQAELHALRDVLADAWVGVAYAILSDEGLDGAEGQRIQARIENIYPAVLDRPEVAALTPARASEVTLPISEAQVNAANSLIEQYAPPAESTTSVQVALGSLALWIQSNRQYPRAALTPPAKTTEGT